MATDSTSSRCVTASHNLEVTNFPLLDGNMGIGNFISSSTFSVGGCDWRINFYLDGNDQKNRDDYVSAFLCFERGTAGVSAMASFSLLGNQQQQTMNLLPTTIQKTFESVGDDWGFSRLIAKSSLRDFLRGLNNGGCLTIRCVVTVKQQVLPHTEDNADAAVLVPQPKLHQDLTDMLKSGQGADVTFSVDGQLFPAHRCILAARSMVFKAELFGAMKEKDARRIEIQDMEPEAFEALLHFVYADSLPDDDCNEDDNKKVVMIQHMLVAADRYGLDRLRLLCEAKLCRDIDVHTVASTLALAEQHHCTQLRGACIGFIASSDQLGAVMKTDGFKHLIASCPSIMEDILDKVAAVWSNK